MGSKRVAAEVRQLVTILDCAYDRRSWHGTNLRGSIRGVSAARAAWRPARRRHNIWEIVLHAAYWKYAVWRRLTGARRGSFPLEGSNWIERPVVLSTSAWHADIRLLDTMHRALRGAVEQIQAPTIGRCLPGSAVSRFDLVAGIAAHDLYHAGQIQLLKKLSA